MKAAVPGILVLALLATAPASAQGLAQTDHPTVTVRGSATVERPPDRAEVAVSIETRGPTLDGTTNAHRARVAQAQAVLDRLRAEGVVVDSGAFGLAEERVPAPPGTRPAAEPPAYRAETRYVLAIPKPAQVEAVVGEVASAGLFEIGPASFSVGDDAAASDAARRAAFADAKRRAGIYAEAGGLRLDGIDSIVDGDAGEPGRVFARSAMAAGAGPVGIVPPASIPFGANVTVTWRIAPR